MSVPAYRVADEDLVDADHKTRRALGPLLDALNRSLTLLVSSFNATTPPVAKAASFTTAANGAGYLQLGQLDFTPQDVWVTRLVPSDGSTLDDVWAMSWIPTTSGAVLLFVGLEPLTTYAVRVRYL